MCGRYSVVKKRLPKEHRFAAQLAQIEDSPHYNAAPSQKLPVITQLGGGIEFFKWGLVPAWAKDLKSAKPINARAETITTSPMFNRLIRSKRCLIPADSFYEWQVKEVPEITLFDLPALPKKTNQIKKPFRIMRRDEDLFTFAGLWDEWLDKTTGELLKTFTIITTEANDLVRPIHDRMPVILSPEAEELWLDPNEKEVLDLLQPYDANLMKAYPISELINSPANNSPDVLNSL